MNLRIAKKICDLTGGPREAAYSPGKINAAHRRFARCRSEKDATEFFGLVRAILGPIDTTAAVARVRAAVQKLREKVNA
jgi:hypothetical protein